MVLSILLLTRNPDTIAQFIGNLAPAAAIAAIILLVFVICRTRSISVYQPRTLVINVGDRLVLCYDTQYEGDVC